MAPARLRSALLALVGIALAACATTAGQAPGLVRITLLQINDVYVLEAVDGGRRGGAARLATLVGQARRENPHTVFVLAGDAISPSVQSALLRGEQMIAALNAIGLDLATFGNHEFDFGPAVLRERMAESRFVWLSSNVVDRRTGESLGGARGDLLMTFGGVRVGFLGLTTRETRVTSSPGPDVGFRDPLSVGRAVAAALRARGAQLVVAVTHQPMADDRALARAAEPEVILGGHEHDPLVAEEGRTLITKAGSDARYLVAVDLWVTPEGAVAERSWRFREVSRRVPPDPGVATLVAAYAARLDRALDVVIGHLGVPLEAHREKLRAEETNTGDFIADLMRERMGTDVALLNGGAVRGHRTVPPGPLSRRDVYRLLPFSNLVLTLSMSGRELASVLERGVAQADRAGGGFLQVSGVRLVWDRRAPGGRRIVSVEVGGEPLDRDAAYTVAVPAYLWRGGDGFTEFAAARVLVGEESGPDLTQLVLDGIAARGRIAPEVDGRLRALGE